MSSGDFPQPLIMESGVDHFRLNVPDIFEQWATGTTQRPESAESAAFEPRSAFLGSLPSPAVSAVRIEESSNLDSMQDDAAPGPCLDQSSSSEDDSETEPPSQLPTPPYIHQQPDLCVPSSESLPLPFTLSIEPQPDPFEFQILPLALQLPIRYKRPRARHDVDGFYTAVLSCKKRRLRTELITSRLSQPFSLPATHIINREAIAAGDKRFMKLAASVEAHKRCPSTQGSMVRRAALLNSTRMRVEGELHEREQGFLRVAAQETSMLHRGPHGSTGGRFLAVAAPSGSTSRSTRVILVRTSSETLATGPHGGPNHTRSGIMSPGLCTAEAAQRRLVKSPLLRPARSPILGPSDGRLDDVADDDETAFPEDDRRYACADDDDDGDDVYSDFGAIFGGAGREDDPLDSEENSYEGYLDELDGISWVGR